MDRAMDRDEGFPPHIIGFMRRKREKEKLANGQPPRLVTRLVSRDFDAAKEQVSGASLNA